MLRPSAMLTVVALAAVAGCRGEGGKRSNPSSQASATPASAATSPAVIPKSKPAASSETAAAFYNQPFSRKPSVAAMTELGRQVFFDPALSSSGKMACSTCHDPHFGYGPPNDSSTQLGGPDMQTAGLRAVPSLRYLQTLPRFAEHHFDESVDESVDQGPTGGHTWDGHADTTHDQALAPLTSPFEMANDGMPRVVAKVQRAAYAGKFRETFGDDIFSEPVRAEAAVLLALEVFQDSPKDFYPYTSRFDGWLRHQLELTPSEARGLALFNDPRKGNCASCHPSQLHQSGFPAFTDFGFQALGIPRNTALPANKDPKFFDLGLCGPQRTDLAARHEYCGEFRVPPLRNVATRRVFFHNGVFHSLQQVLEFYVERDTNPGKWYPKAGGHVVAFDDVPAANRENVNREPPFGRKPGQAPALSRQEIVDLLAFLNALTDADLVTR